MRKRPKQTKNPVNWDAGIKVTGVIVAAVGLVFGIYQFYIQPKRQRAIELHTAKKELCFRLPQITAAFAEATSKEEAEKSKKEFREIYYGPLGIVIDERIKEAADRFGRAVVDWEKRTSSPNDNYILPPDHRYQEAQDKRMMKFRELSQEVASACRESLTQ